MPRAAPATGDREGLHRLACYLHKAPFSLGRMEYARGGAKVIYHGKDQTVSGRGTVAYDPLAFMALLLAHVPEPHEIRVRYYGAASSTIRRGGRKGRLSATPVDAQRRAWNVAGMVLNGASIDDVIRSFPSLTRGQVYECMAYYEDHRDAMDLLIAQQMAGAEE